MAIDSKELRVGNLVKFTMNDYQTDIYRVMGMSEFDVATICRLDKSVSFKIFCDSLIPIEITPEILERNGFVNTSYGYWHLLEDVSPEVRYDVLYTKDGWINAEQQNYSEGKIRHKAMTTIKYLHELQNVFWMARINKEVTI